VACCSYDGQTCYRHDNEGNCWNGDRHIIGNDGARKTWFEAFKICNEAGYRLCASQNELDKCCGTGCLYDNVIMWTSIEDSKYIARDGCSTNNPGDLFGPQPGGYNAYSSSADVACCSYDGQTCYRHDNEGNCWNGDRHIIGNDGARKTWFEAFKICNEAGYRLCASQNELDKCCGTGCLYDNVIMWTSIEGKR